MEWVRSRRYGIGKRLEGDLHKSSWIEFLKSMFHKASTERRRLIGINTYHGGEPFLTVHSLNLSEKISVKREAIAMI